MDARLVCFAVALIVVPIAGIRSTLVFMAMVTDVNRLQAPAERIAPHGFRFAKLVRVVELYRRLYPDGRRHVQFFMAGAAAAAAVLVGAVCLGIIG